jgi:hypothetical protein
MIMGILCGPRPPSGEGHACSWPRPQLRWLPAVACRLQNCSRVDRSTRRTIRSRHCSSGRALLTVLSSAVSDGDPPAGVAAAKARPTDSNPSLSPAMPTTTLLYLTSPSLIDADQVMPGPRQDHRWAARRLLRQTTTCPRQRGTVTSAVRRGLRDSRTESSGHRRR